MSNDSGQREVCAVTALGHGVEPDNFTTHTELGEIRKVDRTHE